MRDEPAVGCTQMLKADLLRYYIAPKSMGYINKTPAAPNVHLPSNRGHVEVAQVLEVSTVRFVLAVATRLEGWGRLVVADTNYLGSGYEAYWAEAGICKPVRCGVEVAVGQVAVQI